MKWFSFLNLRSDASAHIVLYLCVLWIGGAQLWGTAIMQKKYGAKDYAVAVFVTAGCAIFVLYGVRSLLPHVHR